MRPRSANRIFQLPAWDPTVESESSYIARSDAAWKQLRGEYVTVTKLELAKAGLKKLPARRKRRLNAELRIEWAALFRCAGWSIEEIADRDAEETEAVRISVSRILKDLGF
jgi:hypothetical protein